MLRLSPRSRTDSAEPDQLHIYPTRDTKRSVENLKTVAMVFDRRQAVALATRLLMASEQWDKIAVTGFRLRPRKSDGLFIVTVTAPGQGTRQPARAVSPRR